MNAEQLANYLINHDYEIQIVKHDIEAILHGLMYEGMDYSTKVAVVEEAVEIARQDPYIAEYAAKLVG